jgi:hypothetical protein
VDTNARSAPSKTRSSSPAGHLLSTGEIYHDAGGDYFTRLEPTKQRRRLVAQLERLGYTVTLQEAAA